MIGKGNKMSIKYKKFDMATPPRIPAAWTVPVARVATFFLTMPHGGGKVKKINCEGLKPPFIVLSTHGSIIDFPLAWKAIRPYKTNWIISIEEFIGREFIFRQVGGFYKRKFTSDILVVKHALTCLKKYGDVLTFYPEARFSLAGINEEIDGAIGKLVKAASCPVVYMSMKGNFLVSPQWNKKPKRKVPVSGEFEQIVTKEQAETLTADEIQKIIESHFHYNEYEWQYENKIRIDSKYRAHNVHKILYRCPACGKEHMTSAYTKIRCEECGKEYEMDVYGRLHALTGETEFESVPDWYLWERSLVRAEVRKGNYRFEDEVRVEKMMNTKDGFVPIGKAKLTHDAVNGFILHGIMDDGTELTLQRAPETMRSCHIEYNYRKRGDAMELCTLSDTYFVYPLNKYNPLTKLHFATEEVSEYVKEQKNIARDRHESV